MNYSGYLAWELIVSTDGSYHALKQLVATNFPLCTELVNTCYRRWYLLYSRVNSDTVMGVVEIKADTVKFKALFNQKARE
jgi:hypothetical protein